MLVKSNYLSQHLLNTYISPLTGTVKKKIQQWSYTGIEWIPLLHFPDLIHFKTCSSPPSFWKPSLHDSSINPLQNLSQYFHNKYLVNCRLLLPFVSISSICRMSVISTLLLLLNRFIRDTNIIIYSNKRCTSFTDLYYPELDFQMWTGF